VVKTLLVLALVLTAAAPAWAQAVGNWQDIHGIVQSVQGNQLTLKTDDGRIVQVDMAQVSPSVRSAMRPNMGVKVTGYPAPAPAVPSAGFTARYITQDQAGRAAQSMAADPGAVINRILPLVPQFANSKEFQDRAATAQRSREVVDGLVAQLYRGFFERESSPEERAGWTNHLMQTGDLKGTIEAFLKSPEYAAKRKTEPQAISDLYQAFFGRTPSDEEIRTWQQRIAQR
jgi:hypothetical protein